MFCPEAVSRNQEELKLLLNVTCGRDDSEVPSGLAMKCGYLLLVKSERGGERADWRGARVKVFPDADTDASLHYMQVDAVYLVVVNSASLPAQLKLPSPIFFMFSACWKRGIVRKLRQSLDAENYLETVDEQCSCHEIIADKLAKLKQLALQVRTELCTRLREMQVQSSTIRKSISSRQNVSDGLRRSCWTSDGWAAVGRGRSGARSSASSATASVGPSTSSSSTTRSILPSLFPIWARRQGAGVQELGKLLSASLRGELAKGTVGLVEDWARFVCTLCEEGPSPNLVFGTGHWGRIQGTGASRAGPATAWTSSSSPPTPTTLATSAPKSSKSAKPIYPELKTDGNIPMLIAEAARAHQRSSPVHHRRGREGAALFPPALRGPRLQPDFRTRHQLIAELLNLR